ncbi:MAG: phosphotransferase [Eubacteriales bacterium]
MKDIESKVLEQYCVDVNGVRKVRGGFLCDTKQGMMRMKVLSSSDKKIPYVQYMTEQIKEAGFEMVDTMIPTQAGALVCDMRDHGKFVLKRWYIGRECDVYREKEVLEACKTLAILHNYLDQVSEQLLLMQSDLKEDERWNHFHGPNLTQEWQKHNYNFKKARSYMRSRVGKGEFEMLYLDEFESFYGMAEEILKQLRQSEYEELYQAALKQKLLVHGDYNYHNILFVGSQVAITNFERFRIDIPIADFYYFLRKVMEKRSWEEELGSKMLYAYEQYRTVSEREKLYMALRLSYPEKVWKITNYYTNTNKAWISEKNVEKLRISIEQMVRKQQFVQHLFAFHL